MVNVGPDSLLDGLDNRVTALVKNKEKPAHKCLRVLLHGVRGQFLDQNSDGNVDGQILSWLLHLITDALDENLDNLEVAEDVRRISVQVAKEADHSFEGHSAAFVRREVLVLGTWLIAVDMVVEKLHNHVNKD